MTLSIPRISTPALMAVLLLAVAGCGGGGGGGSGSAGSGSSAGGSAPPPVNSAPTISGTPPSSVTAGQPYSFQPSASDPDGQAISFSITGRPQWAAFDSVTGRLSGTPAAGNVGTYANIVISVSDGTASATLPAFAITVVAPVSASATLSWRAPTQNEDGTPLTNLAGYKVRYGQNSGSLSSLLDIANPATTSITIQGLTAGTWYFTLASYTNVGVESDQTTPVSKTIG